jgi:hypothetical protein
MKWYQVIAVMWLSMSMATAILKHGKRPTAPYHMGYYAVALSLWAGILYAGGFWT